MDEKLIDPAKWHIKATPEELASITTYDTRDGLPPFEEVEAVFSQPDGNQYISKYTHTIHHLPWEGLETSEASPQQDDPQAPTSEPHEKPEPAS